MAISRLFRKYQSQVAGLPIPFLMLQACVLSCMMSCNGGEEPIPSPSGQPAKATLRIAVGAGDGGLSLVKTYENKLENQVSNFYAFSVSSHDGAQVALGDVNGDGTLDLIAAPGAGTVPLVKVMDGKTGQELTAFYAFDITFTGGVQVAAGDVDGDGRDDIVAAQGAGGTGLVNVFSGLNQAKIRSFGGFGAGYTSGVSVAVADFNKDNHADLVLGTGNGVVSQVRLLSGVDSSELNFFVPFSTGQTAGVNVAAGDFNGDGTPDFVVGYGAAPLVKVFSGTTTEALASFFAFTATSTGGVRVAAADFDGDGRADIFAAAGAGQLPVLKVLSGNGLTELASGLVFDASATAGVTIAAAVR